MSSLGHAEMIEEGGVELQQWPGSTGLVLQPLVSPWDVLLWQYLHHMLCWHRKQIIQWVLATAEGLLKLLVLAPVACDQNNGTRAEKAGY